MPSEVDVPSLMIHIVAGDWRDTPKKKALFKAIVDHLATSPGLRPEDVIIVLSPNGRDEWSFGRGLAFNVTDDAQKTALRRGADVRATVNFAPTRRDDMSVLVTGATAGFGLAIAKRFVADGHRVVAAGRRKERLRALVAELGDERVHPLELDVRDQRTVATAVAAIPTAFADIYGATKAFVRQFSLNLRADLLGTKVRVTDISPGLVGGTEFSNVRFRGDDARAAKLYEGVEALTPDDIADAMSWVASRPSHVNVNVVELMPMTQAFGPLAVHRGSQAIRA